MCPGRDSNSYAFDGATPSKQYVYQFHHLGVFQCLVHSIQCLVRGSNYLYISYLSTMHHLLNPSANCTRNRTRTCTSLRTLVPETSASTNSAIRANYLKNFYMFQRCALALFTSSNIKSACFAECKFTNFIKFRKCFKCFV